MAIEPGDKVLFMKIGIHASESLESIIERKRAEIRDEGFAFWGYGGNTCHPTRMVQPFALSTTGPIVLAMHPMVSNHFADPIRAKQYSPDGITWTDVPSGINCVGSRHALLIDSLEPASFDLDLSKTRVALGPSRGKVGTNYIKARVDKACLEVVEAPEGEAQTIEIGFQAMLADPYAVFLRY
ncbi:hypothetical protein [Nocardioides marmorisolisilvae]|uniref:Uncharacterized protein n=1 Tax=Nocardioides marmorisolisilvae TaxID=1542737 RepID=A0A3N0DPK9_9ACTN|nr:hypothetical protein [Nocardioides marmorisolisilvae]RNL77588.1 hypothetical protein EFL95_16395 [Nocardioides marmorisolisilvae]